MFKDCIGRTICVGDLVGVAFSYSRASVGYIKVGHVVQLSPEFRMQWLNSDKQSPVMVYDEKRMVLLTPRNGRGMLPT